jgi:hypothetical protein
MDLFGNGGLFRSPNPVVVLLTRMTGFNIDGPGNIISLPNTRAEGQSVNRASHPGGHLGSYRDIQQQFLDRSQDSDDFRLAEAGDVDAALRLRRRLGKG